MVTYSADFKANLGSNLNSANLTVSEDESRVFYLHHIPVSSAVT